MERKSEVDLILWLQREMAYTPLADVRKQERYAKAIKDAMLDVSYMENVAAKVTNQQNPMFVISGKYLQPRTNHQSVLRDLEKTLAGVLDGQTLTAVVETPDGLEIKFHNRACDSILTGLLRLTCGR